MRQDDSPMDARAPWSDAGHPPEDVSVGAGVALLLLRLSLGYFIAIWGVNKLIASDQSMRLYEYFYGISIGEPAVLSMGAAQVALAAMIVLGLWRGPVYLAGLAIHSITIVVIGPFLLEPFAIEDGFPVNRAYAASVPVWAAFAALCLMRGQDWIAIDRWRIVRGAARRHEGRRPDQAS